MLIFFKINLISILRMRMNNGIEFRHTGIPGLWTQELDAGLWTLDPGEWTLDAELWTLDFGRWTLDAGFWTLNATLRKLGSGH